MNPPIFGGFISIGLFSQLLITDYSLFIILISRYAGYTSSTL